VISDMLQQSQSVLGRMNMNLGEPGRYEISCSKHGSCRLSL
jgi:hypothetical protein